MSNTATHTTVGVRVPKTLRAKIAKAAASEHRSVSNLIVKILLERFGEAAAPHLNGAESKKPAARVPA